MWWLWLACRTPDPLPPPGDSGDAACGWGDVQVSAAAGDALAARLTVTPTAAGTLTTTWQGGGDDSSAPTVELVAGVPHTAPVRGLPVNVAVEVTAALDGAPCTVPITLEPVPQGWPAPVVGVDDGAGGEALWCLDTPFGQADTLHAVWTCADRSGRVLRALHHPENRALPTVQPLPDDGLAGIALPGMLSVFDPLGDELDRFTVEELATRFVHDTLDRHEVLSLSEGPWTGALAVLTSTRVDVAGVETQANGIVVIDPTTGEVLWDWSLHGDPDDDQTIDPAGLPYSRVGLAQAPSTDWAHANALIHQVEPTGAQSFWVSLRSHDWIVQVDTVTDRIVARLGWQGDYALIDADGQPAPDAGWFFHQHAPRFVDGDRDRLIVFDNGNVRPDAAGQPVDDAPYSRVVELQLDHTARTATVAWSWGGPEGHPDHFYSRTQGSAFVLPDGAVGVLRILDGAPEVVEVQRDGSVRWQAHWPGHPPAYRALQLPGLYP